MNTVSSKSYSHKVAVYIGRFQPFHNGHLALLMRALEVGEKVVVVLGSSFRARNTKNPLTWQERANMIRMSLPEALRDRVHFVPVRDYYGTGLESDARWVAAVQDGVASIAGKGERSIALVGHFKDSSSYYLNKFPGWTLVSCDREGVIDATHLRNALYQNRGADEATLALLTEYMPVGAVNYLKAWLALPFFAPLAKQWGKLKEEKKRWEGAPYAPKFITVDALVTCNDHVLLIERGGDVGIGLFAIPGGFLEDFETLYEGALRELHEETNLGLADEYMASAFKGAYVFDHPNRSERGRVVTHLHVFELELDQLPEVHGTDDARRALWVHKSKLAELEERYFEDHGHILEVRVIRQYLAEQAKLTTQ